MRSVPTVFLGAVLVVASQEACEGTSECLVDAHPSLHLVQMGLSMKSYRAGQEEPVKALEHVSNVLSEDAQELQRLLESPGTSLFTSSSGFSSQDFAAALPPHSSAKTATDVMEDVMEGKTSLLAQELKAAPDSRSFGELDVNQALGRPIRAALLTQNAREQERYLKPRGSSSSKRGSQVGESLDNGATIGTGPSDSETQAPDDDIMSHVDGVLDIDTVSSGPKLGGHADAESQKAVDEFIDKAASNTAAAAPDPSSEEEGSLKNLWGAVSNKVGLVIWIAICAVASGLLFASCGFLALSKTRS